MTEDEDLDEFWDILRPAPPPEEAKRRLALLQEGAWNTVTEAVKQFLTAPACDRCGGAGIEGHSCPYDDDIHGGSDEDCHCCEACSRECAADI